MRERPPGNRIICLGAFVMDGNVGAEGDGEEGVSLISNDAAAEDGESDAEDGAEA